jgi:hypothetical protein
MKREIRQAESDRQTGSTPMLRLMQRLGIPVARESYLDLEYFGEPPETLSPRTRGGSALLPYAAGDFRGVCPTSDGGLPRTALEPQRVG